PSQKRNRLQEMKTCCCRPWIVILCLLVVLLLVAAIVAIAVSVVHDNLEQAYDYNGPSDEAYETDLSQLQLDLQQRLE
ncbi:hypothetical protein PENTCL1PPCAC_5355, partial [Pristionchus entomophagus]